jgi:hypothetical protein
MDCHNFLELKEKEDKMEQEEEDDGEKMEEEQGEGEEMQF